MTLGRVRKKPTTTFTSLQDFNKEPDATKCFLYYGRELMQQPYKTATLVDRLDESWTEFLGKRKEDKKKFFFYYSFPHVHATQWRTSKSAEESRRGVKSAKNNAQILYASAQFGDTINEMAWAIGRVLESLERVRLDKDTLIIFTSDHGPHRELCNFGGSTGQLRGKWIPFALIIISPS